MKRKQEEEEKELAKALTEAENWSKAHLLRQYRHAAAEAYVRKFGLIPSESDFSKWSTRITELADKIDPLCA